MPGSILILFLVWVSIFGVLQYKGIEDVDIFHQIRTGQLILEQGQLATVESFSYTRPGESNPPLGWLSQILFAMAYEVGSWRAVQWVHTFLLATAYALAAWIPLRGGVGIYSVVWATILGFLVGLTNSSVRPQSFAVCSFALLLLSIRPRMKVSLKLLGLVPILIIWQNSHPSLIVGLVAISALASVAWARWFLAQAEDKPWGLTLAWFMVFAGQVATPLGAEIFSISKANLDVARYMLRVSEWLEPWAADVRGALVFFWFALAISGILMIWIGGNLRAEDCAVFLAMTGLALVSARFALFWGIAMIPLWAKWFQQVKPLSWFQRLGAIRIPLRFSIPIVVAGLLIGTIAPWLSGQPTFQDIPIDGIRVLKEVLPQGRIFTYREWSGPLILAGAPRWKVSIDGRLYLYKQEAWENYNRAASGQVPLEVLWEAHHPDAFFLHPGFHRMLILQLRKYTSWEEIYADSYCVIFVQTRVP
mgnify:CR=1 FL=1